MRILIVEDTAENAELLSVFLKMQGHEPHVVGKVSEARPLLENKDFDAVILDQRLPDGDGLEMLRLVRRTHPRGRWVPAVMITAEDDGRVDEIRNSLTGLQPAGILQKPFDLSTLMKEMEILCHPRRKPS